MNWYPGGALSFHASCFFFLPPHRGWSNRSYLFLGNLSLFPGQNNWAGSSCIGLGKTYTKFVVLIRGNCGLTHSITRYQFRGLGLVWFLSLREGGAKSKAVKRKMPGLYAVGGGSYRSILRCAFLWSPPVRSFQRQTFTALTLESSTAG